MHKSIYDKLKRVRLNDIVGLFLFLVSLPIAFIYRVFRPNLYLLCEYGYEARDNAYWLFKFIRENDVKQDAVYAIKRKSPDFEKVSQLGEVVEYGILKHWIFYLTAKINISTQKGGKPNAAVCYLLEVVLKIIKSKRVFLQHGITVNLLPYLYYSVTLFSLFMCGAKPEYEFVKIAFGYPKNVVKNVGLCRFDALYNAKVKKHQILIIPTWRDWLYPRNEDTNIEKDRSVFIKQEYYIKWQEFINDEAFHEIIADNNCEVYFYLHRNMQMFSECFTTNCPNITIANWEQYEVQKLIKESYYMITDYSSVVMDFAYTKKSIVYYQFDYNMFRELHQPKAYFSYEDDGFGPVCYEKVQLVETIGRAAKNEFKNEQIYIDRTSDFFSFSDDKNCYRNYLAIKGLENSK